MGLVALFLIYAIFIKPDPTADTLVSGKTNANAVTSQEARILGSQISQALLKIEQITLDRSIFNNPIFISLEDRSRAIVDEPVGRTNPFAPLGDTSVNISITTRTNLEINSSTSTKTTSTATTSSPLDVSTSTAN